MAPDWYTTFRGPRDLSITRSGHIWFQDDNGTYGVFASADHGQTWNRPDNGLTLTTTASTRASAPPPVFAPSDERVGLLVSAGDGRRVHLTTDGGGSWVLLPLPVFEPVAIAFDPSEATHMYILDYFNYSQGQPLPVAAESALVLWESHDTGRSWSNIVIPPSVAGNADKMVIDRTPAGTSVLIAAVLNSGMHNWLRTKDDGKSWQMLTLPQSGPTDLIPVEGHPGTLVWAGATSSGVTAIEYTTDDFATVQAGPTLPTAAGGQATCTQALSLQSDNAAQFFLARQLWATNGPCQPPPPNNPVGDLLAFRLTAVFQTGEVTPRRFGTGSPPAAPPGPNPPPPPVPNSPDLAACNLAPLPLGNSPAAGSITFDGRYLDYTHDEAVPGVIYREDPHCVPVAPLALHPQDFPSGKLPALLELSYDPDFVFPDGTPGAILGAGEYGTDPRIPSDESPIYAVNPVDGRAVLLLGTVTHDVSQPCATPQQCNVYGEGDALFAYDEFHKAIWSLGLDANGSVEPGLLHLDGTLDTGCLSNFVNPYTGFRPSPNSGVSTWTLGSDNAMYVQMEDDSTVYRVDATTCQILGGFAHRQYQEGADETDQMACDPVTFGPGSASGGSGGGYSVLWIRDAASNTMSAYPIPDGYCPFPTRLAYTGVASAAQGQALSLCFDLTALTAGSRQPLANQPVQVIFNGLSLGTGMTNQGGTICRSAVAPSAGGSFLVSAKFAGNSAYLPSSVDGTLAVLPKLNPLFAGLAVPPVSTGGFPPQPGPGAGSNPAINNEPATSVSAQAEAQTQAQMQSQAQAQSATQAQPGLMMQRQRQSQIAAQKQGPHANISFEASRLRQQRSAPVSAIALAVAMLGLAVMWRRPRSALARSPGRRRRCG